MKFKPCAFRITTDVLNITTGVLKIENIYRLSIEISYCNGEYTKEMRLTFGFLKWTYIIRVYKLKKY